MPRVREGGDAGVAFARCARLRNVSQSGQQTGDMVTIATVPDLPGGFTAGRWGDETLDMAQEAIELH